MQGRERSGFVRSVGEVVLDSLHPPAFVTGLVLSLPFLLAFFFAFKVESRALTTLSLLFSLPLTMYVQARLAMNGLAGDSSGGLFAESGGSLEEVIPVFGRLVTLTAIWILPGAVMVGMWEPKVRALSRFPFPISEYPPVLLVVYIGMTLIAPFFLLTVAVAASRFAEVFSASLWGSLFVGRTGEVFLMVAAAAGAPCALLLVAGPWLSAAGTKAPGLAAFLGGALGLYLLGVAVSIHARLCGFFASAVLLTASEETVTTVETLPVPDVEPSRPSAPAVPAEEISRAWAAHESDPKGALERLEAATAGREPDARVRHAAALMRHRMGDEAGSLEAAREAIPLCLIAGEPRLAAELYRIHAAEAPSLQLDPTQLAAIGEALMAQGDPQAAANAWAHSLASDASNLKAYKGLLKVADHHLQKGDALERAIRIYDYLLERAPSSPFAEHVRSQAVLARKRTPRS